MVTDSLAATKWFIFIFAFKSFFDVFDWKSGFNQNDKKVVFGVSKSDFFLSTLPGESKSSFD